MHVRATQRLPPRTVKRSINGQHGCLRDTATIGDQKRKPRKVRGARHRRENIQVPKGLLVRNFHDREEVSLSVSLPKDHDDRQ